MPLLTLPTAPGPTPLDLLQQLNIVAVQGRGLHLSIHTLRFILALSHAAPRLRVQLVESWDSGGCAAAARAHLHRRAYAIGCTTMVVCLAGWLVGYIARRVSSRLSGLSSACRILLPARLPARMQSWFAYLACWILRCSPTSPLSEDGLVPAAAAPCVQLVGSCCSFSAGAPPPPPCSTQLPALPQPAIHS